MHIIRILNHVLLWSKNGYPQLHPWGVWWPGWVVRPSCLKPSSVGFNSLNGLGEPLAYLNIYLYSYLEGLVTVLACSSDFNATDFLKIVDLFANHFEANFISIIFKLHWNNTQAQHTFRVKSHKLSFTFKATKQWHTFD